MERTFEEQAEGATELDVQIHHGDIVARSAEGDWQLAWQADGDNEPEVEREGGVIHVRQRSPERGRMNLRLAIPARVEQVRLRTGAGKIDAEALRGVAHLETGHGDLFLRRAGGMAELKTGSGRIEVRQGEGRLKAQSGHGDIILHNVSGEAAIETGAGKLEVRSSRGLVLRAHSGQGDILLPDGSVQALEAATSAGRVECSAELASGHHALATGMGDVLLRDAPGDVVLTTGTGRIEVRSAEGHLHAHSGHGDIVVRSAAGEVELDTSAGRIEIEAATDLQARAHSGRGDIRIASGTVRKLVADTGSGKIQCLAQLAAGTHRATSGNGDVLLESTAGEAELRSGSGKIEVGALDGRLNVHTGSGDIRLRAATGKVEAHSGSGRIEVIAPRDVAIYAHTGNGDIRIGPGTVSELNLQSNSGRVECLAQPGPGQHELSSRNGDVLLQLASGSRARVDLQTSAGEVHSDFSLVRVGRPGAASFNSKRMVGSIGEGEPEIDITLRTSRGQIFLRRGGVGDAASGEERRERASESASREVGAGPAASSSQEQPDRTLAVLKALAQGDISVEEADALLAQSGA